MVTRRTFTALASLAALASQASAQGRTSGRRAEVDALRRFAETTHPRGREAAADADWQARWTALAADADTLTDGAYFIRTRRALGWFKDGHTVALPFEFVGGPPAGDFSLQLPFQARAFHDGVYVIATAGDAAPLLGARITRLGRMDSTQLMRTIAEHWPGNDAWAHRWGGYHFSNPALLEGLGAVERATAPIAVEAMRDSRRVRVRLTPRAGAAADLAEIQRAPLARETWAAQAGFGNYARVENDALYISCDDMTDLDGKSFRAFTQECFAALENPAVERVILDVSRNGGGNNFLPEPLRKRLLRSRFNTPGRLYVIIGPMTFSAAQNPSTRLERDSFALFVGEPSGGSPNHYGDARPFQGEASGITSIVSTLPWFDSYPMDERAWIMPDLLAPSQFEDWRAGRDLALQTALTHRPQEIVDELSPSLEYHFARPSQRQEWTPFWRA